MYRSLLKIIFLSFFVHHQFRVRSIFFIRAHQQETHICDHSEAPVSAEFTRKLVAEIGLLVIQEPDFLPVRQVILDIDVFSYQCIQLFHLWKPALRYEAC